MRLRVRFAKLGRIRWTSQRDTARLWERILRRAGVPLSYTAGFTPRPQLSFGLALPTGCESTAEYLDVAVAAPWEPATLAGALAPHLPEGIDVLACAAVEPGASSLQEDVSACQWDVVVPATVEQLEVAVAGVLAAASLPISRERKGRQRVEDLRPSVLALSVAGADGSGSRLVAELATRPRGVRPTELAEVLGLELGLARRTCQWIERDGSRTEPLAVDTAFLSVGRAS